MKKCKFGIAWVGKCNKETLEGTEYCTEHSQVKCVICGEQATHECPETFQFVCGFPLCSKEDCRKKHHPNLYQ